MAITLKDVASVAGVSTATVSRALAGSENVSPQTADHVRTIASDLGYRYDNVARALRQKRSNLIGMVAPDYGFPYAREFLYALNQEFFQDEFVLAPVVSFGSVRQELAQVERLLGQRIDALLIVPANSSSDIDNSARAVDIALEEGIPVFQVFRQVQHAHTVYFQLDYVAGMEFALRSIGRGAIQSVAYIDDAKVFAAQSKLNACKQAMTHLAADGFSIVSSDGLQQTSYDSALMRASSTQRPDLIICSSNRALPFAANLVQAVSQRETGPVVLSLDPVPPTVPCAGMPVISLEFSMGALARGIFDCINAALNDVIIDLDTMRIQPFLNMSRL